jgi:hypothetical protein
VSRTDAQTLNPTRPEPETSSDRSGRWWVRPFGYAAGGGLVVVVAIVTLWFVSGRPDERQAAKPGAATLARWQRPVVTEAGLTEQSGVRIQHVSVSGGGGLVDLRFQVVDPDKAAAVHDLATPAAVVDESTGLVVNALLMGHSHTAPFKPGVTYYLVFENPGNLVHRGSDVSVLLGNAQVEHVVVE